MIDPQMMQAMMQQGPPMADAGASSLPYNMMEMPFEQSVMESLPPPPEISFVVQESLDLEDYWRPQKERMWLDDKLYHLKDPRRKDRVVVDRGTKDASEFAALPELRVIADKFMNRVGRSEPLVQVPARDINDDQDAQEIENYTRWIWKKWGQDHILTGGKMALPRQETGAACVRGWIDYRVWFDPDDEEMPFMLDLFDPMYVYPEFDRKGVRRVFVIQDMTVNELIGQFPEFEEEIRGRYQGEDGRVNRNQPVRIIGYYDRFYHAMVADNAWLKEPTPHGMGVCPWVCIPNQGGLFEAPYGEGGWNDWTEYYGDSIFAALRDPYRVLVRLYSALLTQVAKDANPPVIITTRNGNVTAQQINLGVGGTTVINDPDAKVQAVPQSTRPGLIETAVAGVKGSIAKGSIPDIEWGHDMNQQSGFARVVLSSAADDVFSPIVTSIQMARAAVTKIVLEIIAKHQLTVPMVAIRKGVQVAGQQFSFENVQRNGTYVEFSFQQLTPQDMVAIGGLVVNLVRAGIISYETALSDKFLGIENPALENEKKLREKALFDPMVMQILIDMAMQQDPTDPIAVAWQQKKFQEQMAALMAASQGSTQRLSKQVGTGQPREMRGEGGANPAQMMMERANAGGMM